MVSGRKVILYIAMSLDGIIAMPDDDLSFLSIVEKEGEDYGYNEFVSTIDTVIIGRRTHDWIKNMAGNLPYDGKSVYVITRKERSQEGNVVFYNGDLTRLIAELKSKPGFNIFCDGGSQVVNELLRKSLIDEMIISIIPVIVGKGIKLFQEGLESKLLSLIKVKSFETGLVQFHYLINKN